jgi:hypothetical protein
VSAHPGLAQVDVGVNRFPGCGVCVLSGVRVWHRRDLPTWTGSQGAARREDFR